MKYIHETIQQKGNTCSRKFYTCFGCATKTWVVGTYILVSFQGRPIQPRHKKGLGEKLSMDIAELRHLEK